MLIIADARLPYAALHTLSQYGEVYALKSQGIVYDSISGHPDIFICQDSPNNCVVAPNSPQSLLESLKKHHINYEIGNSPVGQQFPKSTAYNAVVTKHYFIHHLQHSDPKLQTIHKNKTSLHIPQAYSRCNLIALPNGYFLCSDRGIKKALQKAGLKVYYFSPEAIQLEGHPYGFIGGCMGIHNSTLFISGSLHYHPEGKHLRQLLQQFDLEIIELYQGKLIDGGGILCFENTN